jgi:hypothetical protein
MPKIGDIKVTKGRGHRLMVWCGREWKGVALENRVVKNRPYDLESKQPVALKKQKSFIDLPESKVETISGGVDALNPVEISLEHHISICNTDASANHFLFENGVEGQEKIIIHNSASSLPGNPFIMYTKQATGPGYFTVTSDGARETSIWLFTSGYWWLMSGQSDFIIT